MITKIQLKGQLVDLPQPYAPASYHHPHPNLACIEACIRECLPGVRELELAEVQSTEGMMIFARIRTSYQGSAVGIFMKALREVVQRHIPKNVTPISLLLDVEHA